MIKGTKKQFLNADAPLYRQVKNRIRKLLDESDSVNGISLSDSSLSKQFGVSRITVRQAVKELADEGLLYRIQGVGTFVRQKKLTEKLTLTSFLESWSEGSNRLDVQVENLSIAKANNEVASLLNLNIGDDVSYVKRLRLRDNILVAIDDRFIPIDFCNHLTAQDIKCSSLVDYLRNRENVIIKNGIMDIEARIATTEESKQLNVRKGHPILFRKVVFFDSLEQPVLAGMSYYRADMISYQVTITQ